MGVNGVGVRGSMGSGSMWSMGRPPFPPSLQCELYHWVDLLDRFDGILADAGRAVENMAWLLACDRPDREQLKALLLAVLNFTALLIEYSFSRHLYSSIEVGEGGGKRGAPGGPHGAPDPIDPGEPLTPTTP